MAQGKTSIPSWTYRPAPGFCWTRWTKYGIITNYDPRKTEGDGRQLTLFPGWEEADEDDLHYELIHEPGLSA